ncbi:Hypothetical protein SRAE_1000035900 [Strongyloides ratti]|uniref:Uncharacterized protein n=1 Tax=Strongyloides ratti TaxID=34506 RepID=A0A090KX56_STRRB|nr:Hypothetical protein SRAE_1000035900 [Strongyloides ratti]CEF62085.1 Hypothetical protein SRAE_1000035900 [Strongyloides ratti]
MLINTDEHKENDEFIYTMQKLPEENLIPTIGYNITEEYHKNNNEDIHNFNLYKIPKKPHNIKPTIYPMLESSDPEKYKSSESQINKNSSDFKEKEIEIKTSRNYSTVIFFGCLTSCVLIALILYVVFKPRTKKLATSKRSHADETSNTTKIKDDNSPISIKVNENEILE